MIKIILVIAFAIPNVAFATGFTLDDIKNALPDIQSIAFENIGLQNVFDILGEEDVKSLNDENIIDGGTSQTDYEDYLLRYVLPSDADSASSSISEIASKVFKTKELTAKKSCVDTEFSVSLRKGDYADEVKEVQRFLNQNARTRVAREGPGSPGKETGYFGSATLDAVKRFQALFAKDILERVGLKEATGFWGPSTIKKANEITALCR